MTEVGMGRAARLWPVKPPDIEAWMEKTSAGSLAYLLANPLNSRKCTFRGPILPTPVKASRYDDGSSSTQAFRDSDFPPQAGIFPESNTERRKLVRQRRLPFLVNVVFHASWTPKACIIMAFCSILKCFGPSFYVHWGFGYGLNTQAA